MTRKFSLFLCCMLSLFGYSLYIQKVQASTYLEESCPDSITGEVLKVEDQDKVDHMMAKVIVTLDAQVFDGVELNQDSSEVSFKYPKFAINKFKVGESYHVGMRKGRVCFVERES